MMIKKNLVSLMMAQLMELNLLVQSKVRYILAEPIYLPLFLASFFSLLEYASLRRCSAMNSESALLNSLRDCRDFQGMYRQFACFLQPFEDFVYIDYYNPLVIKKSEKSFTPKELTTEKIRSLAGQFNQFFPKVLKLLAKLLRRSPDGERMREENVTELFGIYRLTIHCLLCTAPCLTDKAYSVHLNWCQLVHLLKTWKKYNDAEEECYALLESLNSFLVTPPSPSADNFPMMAHEICSIIDVKWDRRLSFLVEVLKMTLEVSFCEDKECNLKVSNSISTISFID